MSAARPGAARGPGRRAFPPIVWLLRSPIGMLGSVKTLETMNAMPIGPASLVVAAGDEPDC